MVGDHTGILRAVSFAFSMMLFSFPAPFFLFSFSFPGAPASGFSGPVLPLGVPAHYTTFLLTEWPAQGQKTGAKGFKENITWPGFSPANRRAGRSFEGWAPSADSCQRLHHFLFGGIALIHATETKKLLGKLFFFPKFLFKSPSESARAPAEGPSSSLHLLSDYTS